MGLSSMLNLIQKRQNCVRIGPNEHSRTIFLLWLYSRIHENGQNATFCLDSVHIFGHICTKSIRFWSWVCSYYMSSTILSCQISKNPKFQFGTFWTKIHENSHSAIMEANWLIWICCNQRKMGVGRKKKLVFSKVK